MIVRALLVLLSVCLWVALPAKTVALESSVLAMRSVVSVLPVWPGRPPDAEEPEGSGVVVFDGRTVITALHVLKTATKVLVRDADGNILKAEIVGRDRFTDLALLKIKRKLTPLPVRGDARLGEKVCAIGNAFGLRLSMTCGTVSAVHRTGVGFNAIEDFVQTDAAVNPGTSGGALIDHQGFLVGILSAIFTKGPRANIGVNFAVSAPLAMRVAQALAKDGKVSWRLGGLALKPFPAKGDTGTESAEVASVGETSGSGLKAGDRIMRVGKFRVRKPRDFWTAVARAGQGRQVQLSIMRGDEARRVKFTTPGKKGD